MHRRTHLDHTHRQTSSTVDIQRQRHTESERERERERERETKARNEHQVAGNSLSTSSLPFVNVQLNVKSFPSHKAHGAALISVSWALSQTPRTDHGHGASASRGVQFTPQLSLLLIARRDGQAELTWVAGISRWFAFARRSPIQVVTGPGV